MIYIDKTKDLKVKKIWFIYFNLNFKLIKLPIY